MPPRTRSPRRCAGVLLAALLLSPAMSRAAPRDASRDPTRYVSDEAAFVAQVRPRALHAQAPLLRSLLLLWPAGAAALAQAHAVLGVDLLDEPSFRRTGLDPDAPLVISGFAIDRAEVDLAYYTARAALGRRDWKGFHGLPPAFYRHRVAARVADPTRLGAFLASQEHRPLTVVELASLQQLFGFDRTTAAEMLRILRSAGAVAVARLPGDGVVLVRVVAGEVVVVDLLQPWLGTRPSPADLARQLARVASAPARGGPAPGAPGAVAATPRLALPADAAAVLHLRGAGLVELVQVNLRERALAAVPRLSPARRDHDLSATDAQVSACRDGLEQALAGATFADPAAALRVGPRGLDLRLAWAAGARRPRAFATHDDRVVSLDPVTRSALAVLQVRFDLAAFPRQVTRTGPLARGFAPWSRFLSGCGPLASFLAAVRLWPELLALALEEAQGERDAGVVVAGLHNLTVAVPEIRGGEPRLLGFASLDPPAARRLGALARAGRTPVHLAKTPLPGGRVLVLAASDRRLLTLGRRLMARRGPPKRPAAELRADVSSLLRARATGPTAALFRLLADRLGAARGELQATAAGVAVDLHLEVR